MIADDLPDVVLGRLTDPHPSYLISFGFSRLPPGRVLQSIVGSCACSYCVLFAGD
jgi:hypothetical protein